LPQFVMRSLQMADIIKHQGIVENINGSHLKVRIIQASACAACSVKGHCSSADTKEKLIDVTVTDGAIYKPGDSVILIGALSMGMKAVFLAFILPFFILVIFLFVFMSIWNNELWSSLCSLFLLAPYYLILGLNKNRLAKNFSFSIEDINRNTK